MRTNSSQSAKQLPLFFRKSLEREYSSLPIKRNKDLGVSEPVNYFLLAIGAR